MIKEEFQSVVIKEDSNSDINEDSYNKVHLSKLRITYANGDVYIGNYSGKKHGEGTLTYIDGGIYEGSWIDNKKHGQGTLTYAGDIYIGSFVSDKRHGEGIETYANGDIYEGNWADDCRHGEGTYSFARGGSVYKGSWSLTHYHYFILSLIATITITV